jgi:hypothetical protein
MPPDQDSLLISEKADAHRAHRRAVRDLRTYDRTEIHLNDVSQAPRQERGGRRFTQLRMPRCEGGVRRQRRSRGGRVDPRDPGLSCGPPCALDWPQSASRLASGADRHSHGDAGEVAVVGRYRTGSAARNPGDLSAKGEKEAASFTLRRRRHLREGKVTFMFLVIIALSVINALDVIFY